MLFDKKNGVGYGVDLLLVLSCAVLLQSCLCVLAGVYAALLARLCAGAFLPPQKEMPAYASSLLVLDPRLPLGEKPCTTDYCLSHLLLHWPAVHNRQARLQVHS